MPAHNQERYVQDAIASVIAQSFSDWELIIIDDGSTDRTPEVMSSIVDARIRCFYQPNHERSVTRNTGLTYARGRFVAFLDADDFWHPSFLESQRRILITRPDVRLVACGTCTVDMHGRIIDCRLPGIRNDAIPADTTRLLLRGNQMSCGAVLARINAVRSVGGFDPKLRQGEDWDLWIRLSVCHKLAANELPLFYYRRQNDFMPARIVTRGGHAVTVSILNQVFAQVDLSSLEINRSELLATHLFQAAWLASAIGEQDMRNQLLASTLELDPAFGAHNRDILVDMLAHAAVALYAVFTPISEGLRCISSFFTDLPEVAHSIAAIESDVRSRYVSLHVFHAARLKEHTEVLRAGVLSLRHPSRITLSRGFLVLLVRSLAHECFGHPQDSNRGHEFV
ncbi:MAG: glycosyltransferase family 2 protein [Ardenticatenia bacterium]|nr:glycosyltransferase family 2 protein [Ardenticatenia bacterium]